MSTEWNGEGLPPVGCACEYNRAGDWVACEIVFISDFHVILQEKEEICWKTQGCQFRPIRTEADRKRDEAAVALTLVLTSLPRDQHVIEWSYSIVEKIVAGKIPHITLK